LFRKRKAGNMKFFIVALMSAMPFAPNGEAFIFTTQTFDKVEQCQEFAQQNMVAISIRLIKEFGPKRPPQLISCVEEEVIKQMLDPVNGYVPPKKEDLI